MRAYAQADEQRVRLQAHVREWVRSALLESAQADALLADVRTDLKRTNRILRPVLAFFTGVIVSASVGFVFAFLSIRTKDPSGTTLMLFGLACGALAELIVAKQRLYRFGVEEALAMAAVLLTGLGAALLTERNEFAVGLTVAAATAFFVYCRLGLVYSAIIAMICAAAIPFQFHLVNWVQRFVAAGALGAVFVTTRRLHLRHGDEFLGDEYASLQAVSWLGTYLVTNLRIFDIAASVFIPSAVPSGIYWTTFVLIWLLPIAGLTIAIREKDRQLLAANLLMSLLTLMTNKPYLGWVRYSWDPMLLGVLLAAVAIALRRWLSRGPAGQRAGFTSVPLLDVDREALRGLGTMSIALQPHAAHAVEASRGFDGGRSGGGGADTGF